MSNAWLNLFIILLIVGAALLFVAWRVLKGRKEDTDNSNDEKEMYLIPVIKDFVMNRMTEITTMELINLGLSKDEYHRQLRRREELKEALKKCNTGDISSKTYVREFIYDMLIKTYNFNEENVNWVLPFQSPSKLSARDAFDILLLTYQKKHGRHALGVMIEEYGLADAKPDGGYRIYEEEIRKIYKDKIKQIRFEDKLRVITNRIYSHYKGFGVIDDIRDMSIDGVSGGVSGVPNRMNDFDDEEGLVTQMQNSNGGLNSVWVMYKGKSIHFTFLAFDHEAELRRVVENIYKYNYPGQLSESRPFMINEMYDGSRVTVVRPKFSESWAFFIRKKFDAKKLELEQLVTHKNSEIVIEVMKYLMKGLRITSITGAQGSGKTTLLMSLVGYLHKALNLRIQETSFELNLRALYPDRNILSFQETDNISGQDGLDLQKKTDGAVNILGEVATDPVAAWMIQTSQVASLSTIFTHHAKKFSDLVYALRNSMLKTNVFNNESIAEEQVVSVLEFDIHLDTDIEGVRYIERITECIPLFNEPKKFEKPLNASVEEKMDQFYEVASEFFRQQTQHRKFEERNIIEFRDGEYVAVNPISKEKQEAILKKLSADEQVAFREFLQEVWGNVA
ncbi:MAG: ATPase, T2SS/T4P/T4SS family [Psychrobacillus sp.]